MARSKELGLINRNKDTPVALWAELRIKRAEDAAKIQILFVVIHILANFYPPHGQHIILAALNHNQTRARTK